jgi:hypothetical protein
MKKSILLSLLLALCISGTAQNWVTIADEAFAIRLNQLFPNCMNGNQMNTECPEIVNATILSVTNYPDEYLPIHDLTGLEYFVNLVELHCMNNNLTFLPELPPMLMTLECYYNPFLTSLPELPLGLIYLSCGLTSLTSLPELPPALESLLIDDCNITLLPELPETLTNLRCASNDLTELPELPSSLIYLSCNHNNLIALPELPSSLTKLFCHNNNLTELPELPQFLNWFLCQNNEINCLPTLPMTLESNSILNGFNISNNPFTCLPNYVPAMSGATNSQWLDYPLCDLADLENNPSGCGNAILTFVLDIGVSELSVFPNPGTGVFNVSVKNGSNSIHQSTLEIYNLRGQRILQQQMNENQTVLDLSTQPAGIYMLRMQNTFGTKTMKLVKQ